MNIELKVNAIIKHLTLDFKLFNAMNEKNNHVRQQDFEGALKYREQEVAIRKEFLESSRMLQEILNNEQQDI